MHQTERSAQLGSCIKYLQKHCLALLLLVLRARKKVTAVKDKRAFDKCASQLNVLLKFPRFL